jgi:hypothetical protein
VLDLQKKIRNEVERHANDADQIRETHINPLHLSVSILERSSDGFEVVHDRTFCLDIDLATVESHGHAIQPGVMRFGTDLDVLVHFAHVGVSIFLCVEIRSAEKAGQEIELFDPRVRNAMSAQVKYIDGSADSVLLDEVIKGFDYSANSLRPSNAIVEGNVWIAAHHTLL